MRKLRVIAIYAGLVMVWLAASVSAQALAEKPLALDGRIAADGGSVLLSWLDATPPRVGSVRVERRDLGSKGGGTWRPLTSDLGPVMVYTDTTIEPGQAYEYRVSRIARDIVDVGYWVTGVEVPVTTTRRTAFVIVDETVATPLRDRLRRFARDLTGDGWTPVLQTVRRGGGEDALATLEQAAAIKHWVHTQYMQDPFGDYALILVGHVPFVRSGRANVDGHGPHAHVSDLFYAEMDGRWQASREGVLLNSQVPSDFIEMQVGRIDFSTVSNNKTENEIAYLQSYFDKNHHWRMGLLGDLRNAYGQSKHLVSELYGLRNIVGPKLITPGGHHDVGTRHAFLWGVDFGATDGRLYFDKASKPVFAINFGSAKQKLEVWFNPMTALLAQPGYTIATGWGARPAWRLEHMALGGTIGEVHRRTVNNGTSAGAYRDVLDYYPTGRFLWRNPVWVNLLGDPTTRAFMLPPPTDVVAARVDQGIRLSWTLAPDVDVLGYRIYRVSDDASEITMLNDGALVEGDSFIDTDPEVAGVYMVKSYGLRQVYAGSFFAYSQGAFAQVGLAPLLAEDVVLNTTPGQPVTLPPEFVAVGDGQIRSFITAPRVGQLTREGSAWIYTPPEQFSGTIVLRHVLSDVLRTDAGMVTITVAP